MIKLLDLYPRHLEGGGVTLLCPKCRTQRIAIGPPWTFEGDFTNLTMKPSCNANRFHAHFDIKNGIIEMSAEDHSDCEAPK